MQICGFDLLWNNHINFVRIEHRLRTFFLSMASTNEYKNFDYPTTMTDIAEILNASNSTPSAMTPERENIFFKSTVIATFLVIFIVGVCANALVIALALKPMVGQPPTTINTYILNVAAADLVYILGCLFFTITNYNQGGWLFGDIGCRIIMSWDVLTMHVSIYILTVMSIERYVAVVHPIESYKYRSIGIARKVSAVVWISAIVLAMPMMIGMSEMQFERGGIILSTCSWTIGNFNSYRKYMSIVFVVTFLVPSSVTAIIYTKMGVHFCRVVSPTENETTTASTTATSEKSNKPRKQAKRKVVQTLFLIVLFFWICYIPFWVYQLVLMHKDEETVFDPNRSFGLTTIVLSYLNSCCNPFLYTLLPRRYNVWRRLRRQKDAPNKTKMTTRTSAARTSAASSTVA